MFKMRVFLSRKEDVRATEKDRVEMYKCFRPGDIVVAKVVSLYYTFTFVWGFLDCKILLLIS